MRQRTSFFKLHFHVLLKEDESQEHWVFQRLNDDRLCHLATPLRGLHLAGISSLDKASVPDTRTKRELLRFEQIRGKNGHQVHRNLLQR